MLQKIILWLKYRKKIEKITDKRYAVKLKYKEYVELAKIPQMLNTISGNKIYNIKIKGKAIYSTEKRIEESEDLILCDPFKMLLKTSDQLRKYAVMLPNESVKLDFGNNDNDYIEFIFSKKDGKYEIHLMYYYTGNDIFLADCEVINGIPQWNSRPQMFIPIKKQGDISEKDNLYEKEDKEWTDTGLLFTKLMTMDEFNGLKWQSVDKIDNYIRLITNEHTCETSKILKESDVTEKTSDEIINNIENKKVGFTYETVLTPYGISFEIKNGDTGIKRFQHTTKTDIENFKTEFDGETAFVLVDLIKSKWQSPVTPEFDNLIVGSRLHWITLYDKQMKKIGVVEFDKWGIPVWTKYTK